MSKTFTKLELYCLQHEIERKHRQAKSKERRERRRAFWAQQASRTSGVLVDRETHRNSDDVWVHRTQDSHFERSAAGAPWRPISRDAYLLRLSGGGFRKAKLPLF